MASATVAPGTESPVETGSDLTRATLAVVAIGVLIAGTLWIVAPFVAALIWAATIVVATWPIMKRVERALGGRRGPAVALMTVVILAVLIVPLVGGLHAIFGLTDEAREFAAKLQGSVIPPLPAWLERFPAVAARAKEAWSEYEGKRVGDVLAGLEPHLRTVAAWFAHQAGSLLGVLAQFVLIAILSAVLYAGGEAWAAWVRRFAHRLAGDRGDAIVVLAGQAVRAVAMGVVVTALLQTVLAGIGLLVVGVPFAGVLTALIFMFCIVQLGPLPVMLGATIWAFLDLGTGWGAVMLAWTLVVGLLDNFLRPVLIKRGAHLPLLLIFAGVIGGLMAFGVVGIFVGPVVLAVAYTLVDEWIREPAGPSVEEAPVKTTSTEEVEA